MRQGRCFISFVALVMGLVSFTASAETYTCTTVCEFGPDDVLDNLSVKDGGVATLTGTYVEGSIVVEDGGTLILKKFVTVNGNVQGFGAHCMNICDATVNGSIQIKNSNRFVVKRSVINGDLQLEENKLSGAASSLLFNTVGGNLQFYKNWPSSKAVCINSNEIWGNLQLVDNMPGTIKVNKNFVESALQCSDNDATITGSGNDAGDIECPQLD